MHTNLPHFSQKSQYQFITFRTKDSTDDFIKKQLEDKKLQTKLIQYNIDKYLDKSLKGAYLNNEIINIAKKYLLSIDKNLCEVLALSIMPNHIHIILVQNDDLSKIIQYIKGGLSFLINKKLGKSGSLWQKDYFDKVVRDEKHFEVIYEYVKNNAQKASLSDAKERFYSIYE